MKKILVERVEEFTDNIKEYEVITKEEALMAIDNFDIAETLVDYASSRLGCIIEIDLETGEVYSRLNNGTYTYGDNTTIRSVAYIDNYYDLESLSQIVEEYSDFKDFEKQFQDWECRVERVYDYEFDHNIYDDVYEAYVVEVLGENVREFYTQELINIMDSYIDEKIYQDTEKFYDEVKLIMEI
ncbi:hypothetical protein [Clostridium beijerinckii]|jgi:hypothetical protein|uniref:hypothetical protein n=1 Tax=Clostridium beijerinckii TaxID=1520 RepID=UPI0022E7D47C|nr:hypothetical protein [Clostridium beijerinckii]MDU6039853.1 hypothetical protein [Clostridium butyricum]